MIHLGSILIINDDKVGNMDIIFDIFRFVVGCYFVHSGSNKFGNPSKFWVAIMDYNLFPISLARFGAASIPSLEFMAGLLFASGLFHKYSGILLILLLLFFTAVLLIATLRGNKSSCGCGGFKEMSIGRRPIVRNLFLIIGVVLGIFSQGSQGGYDFILAILAGGFVLLSTTARLRELQK